ncbi:hypothetical protein CASFOL_023495 [Castilleja foliolosa]|uniref:Homeobox-leucine zipper protein n=1 Tax=Castilleja foliolosa TaxID=1961234 RepID=A0ABD3CMG6_9LAMI
MKRLGSSESLGALMDICPNSTDENNNNNNNPLYTAMMDGYDEENSIDQESCRSSEKKRRLGVDQVKALEKNFEVENKLEPERKVKLAQELGLQPRQVAVWFQNRRARWKTKQLERDYGLLKANYDGLMLNFEKLQHDNEALMKEIREMKAKMGEDGDDDSDNKVFVKDEELMSEEKIKQDEQIQIPISDNKNGATEFGDFKDPSSDSDSSAILNEENNMNNKNSPNCGVINYQHSSPSPGHRDHQFLEIEQNLNNNNFQFQEYSKDYEQPQQFVKIEEHNFFGEESCSSLFSDDQAPSLHWYEWS